MDGTVDPAAGTVDLAAEARIEGDGAAGPYRVVLTAVNASAEHTAAEPAAVVLVRGVDAVVNAPEGWTRRTDGSWDGPALAPGARAEFTVLAQDSAVADAADAAAPGGSADTSPTSVQAASMRVALAPASAPTPASAAGGKPPAAGAVVGGQEASFTITVRSRDRQGSGIGRDTARVTRRPAAAGAVTGTGRPSAGGADAQEAASARGSVVGLDASKWTVARADVGVTARAAECGSVGQAWQAQFLLANPGPSAVERPRATLRVSGDLQNLSLDLPEGWRSQGTGATRRLTGPARFAAGAADRLEVNARAAGAGPVAVRVTLEAAAGESDVADNTAEARCIVTAAGTLMGRIDRLERAASDLAGTATDTEAAATGSEAASTGTEAAATGTALASPGGSRAYDGVLRLWLLEADTGDFARVPVTFVGGRFMLPDLPAGRYTARIAAPAGWAWVGAEDVERGTLRRDLEIGAGRTVLLQAVLAPL